jgi:hypothetical protein
MYRLLTELWNRLQQTAYVLAVCFMCLVDSPGPQNNWFLLDVSLWLGCFWNLLYIGSLVAGHPVGRTVFAWVWRRYQWLYCLEINTRWQHAARKSGSLRLVSLSIRATSVINRCLHDVHRLNSDVLRCFVKQEKGFGGREVHTGAQRNLSVGRRS